MADESKNALTSFTSTKQAGAAEAVLANAEPSKIDVVIEQWFGERVHNSPLSRDTEIFNYTRLAVNDLKAKLSGA